jgi:hypothetical protein
VLKLARSENSYFWKSYIGAVDLPRRFYEPPEVKLFPGFCEVSGAFGPFSSPYLKANWTNSARLTETVLEEEKYFGIYFTS